MPRYGSVLILLVKLLLVPSLLAAVTLAARRWGQGVAGWLGGFPIVAGPVLLVVTLEQGPAFGAAAATGAVAGIAPTMVFIIVYARLCHRFAWWQVVALGYLAWVAAVALVHQLQATLPLAAVIGAAGLIVAARLVRRPPGPVQPVPPNRLELPARMLVGVLLTFGTSAVAAAFGARLAGYAAIFPLVAAVVSVFSHALHGPDTAVRFLAGSARGLWSVWAFALAIALLLPVLGTGPAFLGSLGATLVLHLALRPRPAAAPR